MKLRHFAPGLALLLAVLIPRAELSAAPVYASLMWATVATTPSALQFGAIRNGGTLIVTPTQTVTVNTTGSPAPSWTASSNQSWLQVTGGSGTGPGTFSAAIINPGNVIGSQTSLSATITLTSPTANTVQIPVTLTVDQTGTSTAAAFGQVDTPAQNATGQQGAIGVTGWALDDIGVLTVKIYRSCMNFEPQGNCQTIQGHSMVFVGDAAFLAGARPDVETAFPTMPYNYRGGWGMQILSNMLPHVPNSQLFGGQGTLNIFAIATDVEGHVTLLGRSQLDTTPTTVTLDNDNIAKPFGTADTPVLGSTVSGSIPAFLWVLTPSVSNGPQYTINPNGSTIVMYIDGNATATAAYNQCRGTVGNLPINPGQFCNDDVANVFGNIAPQPPLTTRNGNPSRYRNLDVERGAIAVNTIATTTLSNGLHTVAWGVTDNGARGDGIGSRFFTVLNGSSNLTASLPEMIASLIMGDVAPALSHGAASSLDNLPVSTRFVSFRKGFDDSAVTAALSADSDGVRHVSLAAQDRLVLNLGGTATAGYLVTADELRDLPVGSTFDDAIGAFSWVPPPMYFGTYRLVFVIDNTRVIVDVQVTGT